MKLYYHPRCNTCRKALEFLSHHGITYELHDLTETAPPRDELLTMLIHVDRQPRRLFNTSGQRYRELGMSQRLAGMSTSACIDLLSRDGMLVKRPFLIGTGIALIGFRQQQWTEALHKAGN